MTGWGEANQQIRSFYAQFPCKPVDHLDAGGIDAPLQRTDVGAIYLRSMGKFFLRQASSSPIFEQVGGKGFPDFHDRKHALLKSI